MSGDRERGRGRDQDKLIVQWLDGLDEWKQQDRGCFEVDSKLTTFDALG